MEENLDGILGSLVAKFSHMNSQRSYLNNRDDLMSEARIAAHKAVQDFKAEKRTKLTTYVYTYVKNRLLTLQESESAKPLYHESNKIPETAVECIDQLDHDLTMRSLLTMREYEAYHLIYVQGWSERSLIENGTYKERDIKCLCLRISHKFKSHVESLNPVSMLKKPTGS